MNPLVVVVKEESTISMLLACLYKCIEHDSGWKEPSEWNKVDDVLEAIAKRVAFENDSRCVARYFLFIAQLTTLPIKENLIVQAAVNADKLDSSSEQAELVNYTQLREICQIHDNLLVYRWTKKLFELYKHQTFLGQSSDIRLHLHVSLDMCKINGRNAIKTFNSYVSGRARELPLLHLRNLTEAAQYQMD